MKEPILLQDMKFQRTVMHLQGSGGYQLVLGHFAGSDLRYNLGMYDGAGRRIPMGFTNYNNKDILVALKQRYLDEFYQNIALTRTTLLMEDLEEFYWLLGGEALRKKLALSFYRHSINLPSSIVHQTDNASMHYLYYPETGLCVATLTISDYEKIRSPKTLPVDGSSEMAIQRSLRRDSPRSIAFVEHAMVSSAIPVPTYAGMRERYQDAIESFLKTLD